MTDNFNFPKNLLVENNQTNQNKTINQNQQFQIFKVMKRNLNYIIEKFNEFVKIKFNNSVTLFMPSICGTITFVYILNLLLSSSESNTEDVDFKQKSFISSILTLVPGNILSPNYWFLSCLSMLTYPFVEFHWWQVVNDCLVVSLCCTLIEPLWGRKELITFFFVVNTFVAFFTMIHYIMLYSIYGNTNYLYNICMYGLSGYCAAVCVTIKQILPESVLFETTFGKFKNNNVPLCALIMSYIFYLVNFINGCLFLMFFYGILTSWFYLRFIQYHPSNDLRGDLSPSFDFATFFPSFLKPYVATFCNYLYLFFVKMKLFSPNSHRQYQNLKVLGEQLSQEHSYSIISRHLKQHHSGDYQYLHQPKIENM